VQALPQPPNSDSTNPSNIGDKGIKARACLAPSLRSLVLELKQTLDETAPELPNHWHHTEPFAKQSSLGKRPSQEDLARDDKRFMEEDTAAQWKLQRNKRKMEQKRPYVEREVRID
jgi:hypothetical protein